MVDIPQGVTVRIEGHKMTVKGPHGEVHKMIAKEATTSVNGNKVEIACNNRALLGTTEAVIRNMIHGAAHGYSKNLKLIYAHFPITIEVKGSEVAVKNFLGEKQPRKTVLIGSTKIQAKGQSVTVSGPDKEAVGQTIANLRSAMKIKEKDSRIFQDGIYDAE